MARIPRALFTDGERDAIRDDESMSDATRASHFSRIDRKISERLPTDIELLRENCPDRASDVYEIVCEDDIDERLADLEDRVTTVEQQLDAAQNTNDSLEQRISRLEDMVSSQLDDSRDSGQH